MSTSINRNFSPWDLLKFAAPSIIMMVFMSLYTIGRYVHLPLCGEQCSVLS